MLLQMAEFHSFLWLSSIPLCVCVCVYIYNYIFFIHSSADGHLGCLYALDILNSAAMNIGAHASFLIMIFSGYMLRTGIAGS